MLCFKLYFHYLAFVYILCLTIRYKDFFGQNNMQKEFNAIGNVDVQQWIENPRWETMLQIGVTSKTHIENQSYEKL